jgi:hypothetical protein
MVKRKLDDEDCDNDNDFSYFQGDTSHVHKLGCTNLGQNNLPSPHIEFQIPLHFWNQAVQIIQSQSNIVYTYSDYTET